MTDHEKKLLEIIKRAKSDGVNWAIALDVAFDYHRKQSIDGNPSAVWEFNESIGLRKHQDASAATWYICQLIDKVYP